MEKKTMNLVGFVWCDVRDKTFSRWVHVDYFKILGDGEALSEVERVMSSHCTIQVGAVFGASRDDAKGVRILNRYVR